jgi:DNA modification methylase
VTADDLTNKLYYGDNLDILRGFPDECVDLIYLDPPWNPRAAYNMIWETSKAQRRAFEGTWQWGAVAEEHYAYLTQTARNRGVVASPVSTLIAALRTAGTTPMLAYVVEMTIRLVELHRVLRSNGSLYLHSDPTASHYLKLVLDAIFGPRHFVNEIVWKRQSSHNDAAQGAKHFGRIQDVILFYAKGPDYYWRQPYRAYDESYLKAFYRHLDPETQRRYRLSDITAPGGAAPEKRNPHYEFLGVTRYWRFSETRMHELYAQGRIVQTKPGRVPQQKRYLDEMPGMPVGTWWDDIRPVQPKGPERIGWQTQKPLALLNRIIEASSRPGDVVLDAFCGCGTALDAAQGLGRRWIGIDITWHAIAVMKARLKTRHGIEPQVEGAPTEVDGARQLAQQKPDGREQFEAWALSLVGGIPHGGPQRKGADQGADGIITFSGGRGLESAIVSVKSGHADASDVQKLKGAMERHGGSLGLFVTLLEPSKPMRQEAATAGLYHSDISEHDYPRIQILTIRELVEERRRPVLPPLLASEYRETLWSEAEVPAAPRRKGARRRPVTEPLPWERPPIAEHPRAAKLRVEYASSEVSPVAPPSRRAPRRERPDPLQSRASVDTD